MSNYIDYITEKCYFSPHFTDAETEALKDENLAQHHTTSQ